MMLFCLGSGSSEEKATGFVVGSSSAVIGLGCWQEISFGSSGGWRGTGKWQIQLCVGAFSLSSHAYVLTTPASLNFPVYVFIRCTPLGSEALSPLCHICFSPGWLLHVGSLPYNRKSLGFLLLFSSPSQSYINVLFNCFGSKLNYFKKSLLAKWRQMLHNSRCWHLNSCSCSQFKLVKLAGCRPVILQKKETIREDFWWAALLPHSITLLFLQLFPVCHHRNHRDIRVRRVPQILEET